MVQDKIDRHKMREVSDNSSTLWLVILPPPPTKASYTAFQKLFEPALSRVLIDAAKQPATGGKAILDIGLSLSNVSAGTEKPRSSVYARVQHALAALYRLVCLICAKHNIGLQFGNDVDVRVLIVADKAAYSGSDESGQPPAQGPITTLETLALSQRPWTSVYGIDSADGESLLQSFVALRRARRSPMLVPHFEVDRLAHGIPTASFDAERRSTASPDTTAKRHYSVAVGGTFDHLHAGHKLLLTATALVLEPGTKPNAVDHRCLTVGITGDDLLKSKQFAEVLESWEKRQLMVCDFLCAVIELNNLDDAVQESQRLEETGPNGKAVHYKLKSGLTIKCVQISDPYGPTITDPSISALVISGETRAGGKAVNDKRRAKDWPPLEVFEVDVLDTQAEHEVDEERSGNFHSKISSTAIRRTLHEKALMGD